MKRILLRLSEFSSLLLIVFGLYSLDADNKASDHKISILKHDLGKVTTTLSARFDRNESDFRTLRAELDKSNPQNIYTQAPYVAHLDIQSWTANGITPSNASGILIQNENKEFFIITNLHAIKSGPESATLNVFARLNQLDSYPHPLRMFARCEAFDIALLKLEEDFKYDGPIAIFGDSTKITPGAPVISIGSSVGLAFTCNYGVVTNMKALGAHNTPVAMRISIPQVLMHSATIAPGNSGGPLISTVDGCVVGINYMNCKVDFNGFVTNFYLTIPSEDIKRLLPKLFEGGEVKNGWTTCLRLTDSVEMPTQALPGEVRPVSEGAYITGVRDDILGEPRPKISDVILECNGAPIASTMDFVREIMHSEPGSIASIKVLRGNEILTFNLPISVLKIPE